MEAVYGPRAVNGTSRIGLGAALSTGLRLTGALAPLLFALTGARAAQAMLEASLAAALFSSRGSFGARLGAAGALWLIAELAAACVLALAAVTAAARLRGSEQVSPRWPQLALGSFFVGGAVMIAARLWVWTALGATFTAWLRALLTGEGGGLASFSFALALVIALPLGLFATLWLRAALARAAVRDAGYLSSLRDAAGALGARPVAPLLIVFLTGAIGAVLSGTASAIAFPLTPRFDAPMANEVGWGVGLVSGALGALGAAFAQLWGLSSLCALDAADAGVLARGYQPPPRSVPTATILPDAVVLEAAAVSIPTAALLEEPPPSGQPGPPPSEPADDKDRGSD